MTDERSRTLALDQAIMSAWRHELKVTHNPQVKQQCIQRECELLPRFAGHYQQLQSLTPAMRRSLQRHWKRSLAGLALLMALGQAPALAATINVGGTCTLVRAIVAANNDSTAGGKCRKGSGADTVVLPKGSTQTLTAVNNTNYGATGLPTIRTPITLAGNGSTIRRANTVPAFRIFSVAKTGSLTLQKTIVTGGTSAGSKFGGGGGLLNYGGTLNLNSSTVSGNIGCGISNFYKYYNEVNS